MSITIKELAMMAGVSRGTVDRALNGRGGVAAEVEQRILQLAKEHHYVPNRAGKALAARKKPLIVGVTMPSVGNAFFDEVRQGIQKTAQELGDYGMNVRLMETGGLDAQAQLLAIRQLQKQGIQALALAAINDERIIEKINELTDNGIPVVTFNADVEGSKRLCYVGSDYYSAGRVAGELMGLLTGGRATVGVVTGSVQMLGHNQRISGFHSLTKSRFPDVSICDVLECFDEEEQAFLVTQKLLKLHPETALLYLTGAGTSGCCKALEQSGKDLTVIAFDAVPHTEIRACG